MGSLHKPGGLPFGVLGVVLVLVVECSWWALCWLWGACVGAPSVGGGSLCWLWHACGGGPCAGCGVLALGRLALVIGALCWLVERAGVGCGMLVVAGPVLVVGCLRW
jgi:hypothetical protein